MSQPCRSYDVDVASTPYDLAGGGARAVLEESPGVNRRYHDRWVRHEALCDRVEVGDLHRLAVAAAR